MSDAPFQPPSPPKAVNNQLVQMLALLQWATAIALSISIVGIGVGIALRMIFSFIPYWAKDMVINSDIGAGIGVAIGAIGVAIAVRSMAPTFAALWRRPSYDHH